MINEDNQSVYFWMDPNAELHSVGELGHFRWAASFLKTDKDVYDTMYLRGWLRIASAFFSGQRFVAFNYNSSKSPSNRQIKALKDYCIEIGCDILRDDTKGREIHIDESKMSLKRLVREIQEDMETVDYPLKKLPSGVHQQQPADWTKFKLNGVYGDGDVLRYVQSQHDGFEDDERVDGNYRLQAVDPNTIQDSEWHIDDSVVQSLAQSKKQFPPIVIDKHGSIIDGGHRHAAAKLRGDKKILVFKPTKDINEGPDGIEYDGVNTDIWDNSKYVRMFFILAMIGGREDVSFCYLREERKVVSSKSEFNLVFSKNPPKDSMTTHGDLISYIMDTIGLNLYDSEDPCEKELAMGDVVSMRLIHGRVFEVNGQLIMSCWEKSTRLRTQKSDIEKLMNISGIDPKKVLYETADAPGEFSSYENTFGSGSDKEITDKPRRSDSEISRLEKLHLDANLKKKILKLPPNKFELAADKLNISTAELKNWLGRNVAESRRMIKLKDLLNEAVNGRGYFTKEKFSSVILSELKREFPRCVNIELVKAIDMQQEKHKAYQRADIHNSDLMAIYSVEVNDKEYEVRILNTFKKVPDEELSNKFTMADDDFLRKMDYKSLEPKDLNQSSPLMVWRARVVGEDEKVLIPKKPGYAILFDDYKTLKDTIADIKKVIDKDSGSEGNDSTETPDPMVPNALQPAQ